MDEINETLLKVEKEMRNFDVEYISERLDILKDIKDEELAERISENLKKNY